MINFHPLAIKLKTAKIALEQTVVFVKLDGVQRGLIREIIHRLERKGLQLVTLKMVDMTREKFIS